MLRNYSIGFERIGVNIDDVRGNATKCPKCSHNRKKRNSRCLSVNLKTGNYYCNHCDFKGRVDSNEWIRGGKGGKTEQVDLQVTDFERQAIQKHVQDQPDPFITSPLTDRGYKFFEQRGISRKTVDQVKIAQKNAGTIVFNYYDDGQLVNAKYRKLGEKHFWQHKNAPKRVLWCIDNIKKRDRAIICEGEMDVLSFHEIGEYSAVSVSQGAPNPKSSIGAKLKCFENAVEHLVDKKEIYIAVDNDENGRYLQSILVKRLGKDKCKIVSFPHGCKDANEVLCNYGPQALKECLANAKDIPIDGVTFVRDVRDRIKEIKKNGVQKGFDIGIKDLKDHFSMYKGWWNLYTGIPNSGKSEYVMFLMLCMSLRYGWKWAVFSPEHWPSEDFYIDAVEKFMGDRLSYISDKDLEISLDFINEHFFYVYFDARDGSNAVNSGKEVINAMRRLAISKGIDGFVIDPFNQLTKGSDEPRNERTDQRLERVLGDIDRFCKTHDLCGNIVAHPRTIYKDNSEVDYKCPTAYQIAGGAMWYNKAYTITAVHRPFNQSNKSDTTVIINIQKVKSHKRAGKPAEVKMKFSHGWYIGEMEEREDSALYGALDKYKLRLQGQQQEIEYEEESAPTKNEYENDEYDESYDLDIANF